MSVAHWASVRSRSPSRVGTVGVVVGTNFALTEGILAGVEFQGDAVWNNSGFTGLDGLFLGKLGGYLTDETLIYGTGGLGWVDDESSYALGLGIEQALTDSISVRGEGMATGGLGGGFRRRPAQGQRPVAHELSSYPRLSCLRRRPGNRLAA